MFNPTGVAKSELGIAERYARAASESCACEAPGEGSGRKVQWPLCGALGGIDLDNIIWITLGSCRGVFAEEDWATGKYSAVAAWNGPHPPTPLWNGSLTGFPLGLCVCVCVIN